MTPPRIEVFNMTLPPEGPSVVPVVIDFATEAAEQEIDLTQLVNDGVISYISGVAIDTLEGTVGAIRLECNSTGQRNQSNFGGVTYLPLFQPNPPVIKIRALDGYDGICRLHFVNFPLFPLGNSGSGGGSSTPIPGPEMATDTFLLDATSQEIVAANGASRYFLLQNPTGNGPVTVNLGGGDATAIGNEIAGGGSLELTGGTTSAITIAGTAAESVIFTVGN